MAMSPRRAPPTKARCRIFSARSRRSRRVLLPGMGRMLLWVGLMQVWAKPPRLSPKEKKLWPMQPTSKNAVDGPHLEEEMAKIYALLGDADHAVPILKRLLQTPYAGAITPALLRLDPVWDQIRNDPRFQQLASEKQP